VLKKWRIASSTFNPPLFGSLAGHPTCGSMARIFPISMILNLSESFWKSPATGIRYPVRWRIQVPDHLLDLTVAPVIDHQEHTHDFAYWEGAMRFTGTGVQGMGYLEMTGY
jgi:predicted secreted hydrolase